MGDYYATIKRGAKRHGLAVLTITDPGSCLAVADAVFEEYGILGDVQWGDCAGRKNWAGMAVAAPRFTVSAKQADHLHTLSIARRYVDRGSDYADYCDSQCPGGVSESEYMAIQTGLISIS